MSPFNRKRLEDKSTALKHWLTHNYNNPYPSKPEKIMLAIVSHMTLTQVSTWFANTRRRLKKEKDNTAQYDEIYGDAAVHLLYIDRM